MNKLLFAALLFAVLAGAVFGCSPAAPPSPPPHAAFSLPTLIPPPRIPDTPTAVPTTAPSATPTSTSLPTATTVEPTQASRSQVSLTVAAPTISPTPAASPTATRSSTPRAVASPTASPSPTAAVAPGLYVSDLRMDPLPVRGQELSFFVTFLNSMGSEQNYRWGIYIFSADTQRQISETARTNAPIPAGRTEQQSNGSWRLALGGPCDYFYAQVGWINSENKVIWFTTPGGSLFQKAFTVCPP